MELIDLLKVGMQRKCSDIHLKGGCPPMLRLYGDLYRAKAPPLRDEDVRRLVYPILSQEDIEEFERTKELDVSYVLPGMARFRVNCFVQRGVMGAVFRIIPLHIPSFEELGLPPVVQTFCDRPRGIIFVTGPAGSGKTTTQAAMLDYINSHYPCHIITVEDPIEFVHTGKMALVNQREVRKDTHSFPSALKYSLREDPDVILIGEMRDLETVALAITAAETGHLVLSTLHTTDAVQTIDRVIDIFPTHQQQQIRMQLSVSLVGAISQLLLKRKDGKGMIAAFEVLVGTSAVRAQIREGRTPQLASYLQTGSKEGMQTMEQSLADLVNQELVNYEEALSQANHPEQFDEMVKPEKKQRIEVAAASG